MTYQPADYTALKAARDACIASGGGYTTNDFTGCQSANNVPIANWDVSLVDDMHNLFIGTTSGNEIFNPDLSKWVTGAVTDMRSMFDGQTAFNSDISGCKCLMLFAVDHTSSKRCTHTVVFFFLSSGCRVETVCPYYKRHANITTYTTTYTMVRF